MEVSNIYVIADKPYDKNNAFFYGDICYNNTNGKHNFSLVNLAKAYIFKTKEEAQEFMNNWNITNGEIVYFDKVVF